MICIQNTSKSYRAGVKAVDSLDLEIRGGEIFGFLGPNGAGKSTTIRMITGILSPDEGSIQVAGYNIEQQPLDAKRSFGYVPDDPNVFPRLKALEYLNFLGDLYGVAPDVRTARIDTLATRFAIRDVLGNRIQSFSHGMRQKLVLIGALLHAPVVWILDEPMTGLDPRSSFILKEMMREHADAGKTVFFSTHVLDVAERICDRVGVIDKGRLVFCGTVAELRSHSQANESLEEMFLQLVGDAEDLLPEEADRQTPGQGA